MTTDIKKFLPYVEDAEVRSGDATFLVSAEKIVEACNNLRGEHKFDCLSCLTGVDYGDHLEVVYHLFSYSRKETVVLKTKIHRQASGAPTVQSVSGVWSSAKWMERETFDLLGIEFVGHTDLKRILLPEDWVGHPLRKDYKEPEEYCGMSTGNSRNT